jgi:hypothetical protein
MAGEADRTAFDIASKPAASSSGEFAVIAKMAASVDTLDGFIRDMKNRFPDATARAPLPDPIATGSVPGGPSEPDKLPEIVGSKRASAVR